MDQVLDFEKTRELVSYIGSSIEIYDNLTKKLQEARFNFEMLVQKPERGIGHDQRGREVRTTPQDMADNIQALSLERTDIAKIIFDVTGATTMDGARQVYLNVLSAYQRVGSLRELRRLYDLGFTKALDEAAQSENIVQPSEFDEKQAGARQALVEVLSTLPAFDLTTVEVPRVISLR